MVIAEAMRTEYKMKKYKMILYKMIVDAVCCCSSTTCATATYDRMVPPATFKGLRRWLSQQTDIANHAIEDLPADRVRYHVCWDSWLAGVEDRQARARSDAGPGRHQP